MPSTPASMRPSLWSTTVLLACAPARLPENAGPSEQVDLDAAPQLSAEGNRPIVYACRQPLAADPGYHFEVDGVSVRPPFVSLTGEDTLRPGDIIRLPPADMIVGTPGHYRYFTDPTRPGALELEFDGGPRHLVALRVAGPKTRLKRIGDPPDVPNVSFGAPETIDRPLADLRQLRGLAVETWSDDIAAVVGRLDGAQLIVSLDAAFSLDRDVPVLPSALPTDLRALKLDPASGIFQPAPSPGPVASDPFVLDGLPPLPELRSLELWSGIRSAASHLDAASLARFPVLQRLALGSSIALRDPQGLRALPELRVLDLERHADLRELSFVRELPALRWLNITSTSVDSLTPMAGHPHLAVVLADVTPIAALPEVPPPGLRVLSVMSTRLPVDAVESLAAAAPQAVFRHRWNQRFADVAACATRIHVRTGGMCHRRPERERTLFATDDPAALRELLPLLQIDEDISDSYCMCCGTLTIELYRDHEPMVEATLHHGRSLRYYGWPGDGQLSDPRGLCAWLARHGVGDACGEDS